MNNLILKINKAQIDELFIKFEKVMTSVNYISAKKLHGEKRAKQNLVKEVKKRNIKHKKITLNKSKANNNF